MRARWDSEPATGEALLRLLRERGPLYRPQELLDVEDLKREDRPPRDKWTAG